MSARMKNHEVGPGQDALFTTQEILYPGRSEAPTIASEVINLDEPGVAVNIQTRAHHLNRALEEYGTYRQLSGFQIASDPSSPQQRDIKNRYKGNLSDVRDGALDKSIKSEQEAKKHFSSALGAIALIKTGMLSPEDAIRLDSQEFNNFTAKYFGSKFATKERGKFKTKLNNQSKISR